MQISSTVCGYDFERTSSSKIFHDDYNTTLFDMPHWRNALRRLLFLYLRLRFRCTCLLALLVIRLFLLRLRRDPMRERFRALLERLRKIRLNFDLRRIMRFFL